MPGEDHQLPRWPDDLLYVPVNDPDHERPKGPDAQTWGADGSGCTPHGELYDRRWGIVDIDNDGWRLLTIDLDHHKGADPEEDLSAQQAMEILDGLDAAPETRQHESQSGGTHVFYWVRESELGYEEHNDRYVLPFSLAEGIDDRLNGYVLSTHCAGYTVEEDRQPATIEIDEIPDQWRKDEPEPQTDDRGDWERHTAVGAERSNLYDVPGINPGKHPEDERVAHFSHGSSTGANFMVDAGAETGRCWRHRVTMDDVHANAIQQGIIECGDIGSLTREQRRRMMEAAEEAGLREKIRPSREERREYNEVFSDRRQYEGIETAEFPDGNFILDKPPREGGSHWMMEHFTDADDDLLLLVPRHSIADQHLETLDAMLPRTSDGAVHFEGHNRACEHDGGGDCPRAPESYPELLSLEDAARGVLHEKNVVTAEDAPGDWCPAAFLRAALSEAGVIVTVPQLFDSIAEERDFSEMRMMVDEEQTLSYFWPPSVDIVDIVMEYETDGSISIEQRNRAISDQENTLHDIQETIEAEQEERREGDGGFRRNSYEITIQEAIETYDEIADILGTTDVVSELIERGQKVNLGNAIDLLEEKLGEVELPEANTDPNSLVSNIRDYAAPYFWNDSVDPGAYLTALSFAYEDRPFDFKLTDRGRYSLRLIGEKEREPFFAEEFAQFEQIGIIAGPEGERFLHEMGLNATYIEIESFRYDENYVVVPVAAETEDGETERVPNQRNRVKRISRALNKRRKPHMAVAGTKERASVLTESFTDGTANVVGSPDSPAQELYSLWTTGATAVIYENSVVSRGIDAPFFDITCLCEPGFATPYWEAKARHHKGDESGEYMAAVSRERELKARELTNAALRTAPTRGVEGFFGTKFIAVADYDADDLLYLQDRRLDRLESAPFATELLDNLVVGGAAQVTINDVYRELGGSEKDFVRTAITEEFTETNRDRPLYEKGEISSWADSGLVADGLFQQLLHTIRGFEGPPSTGEIVGSISTHTRAAVIDALGVLERRGSLSVVEGEDGEEHWDAE